jgi:MFS family permease
MRHKRNIKLLTWFNFFTDFKLYAPIAIIYFSRISHSYALGAAVFSIAYITSAILDVPTGIFADRIGRKTTVMLGALFAVLYVVFYAIGINFWILAIGAFFEGISRALYSGNNAALLHNILSEEGLEEEYHHFSGKLSAMFQAALSISGLLGAVIANWSFPALMWLSVIPQGICLLISFQITDAKKVSAESHLRSDLKEAVIAFIHNPRLRLLNISSVLDFSIGETMYQFQAAFYNLVLPIWAVGVAKAASNFFAFVGFQFSGKIIQKYKPLKVLFAGNIYGWVTNVTALLYPTPVSPFLMSSISFFYGTSSTASGTLLQKEFTDKQRATMSSLNSFAGNLFFGIVAFLIGFIADKTGPIKTLLLLQVIRLAIFYVLWKLYHLEKKS